MNFDIALVVPDFNEAKRITATLTNFAKNANGRVLFVLVDNGSTDSSTSLIRKWQKNNPSHSLTLLTCQRRGALYARRKGMDHAKNKVDVIVSTDADNHLADDFYKNVRTRFVSKKGDILRGHVKYEPHIRLLKQLYLPSRMKQIAWQEAIEEQLFGKFFFGGYFGVRSSLIQDLSFPVRNVPMPDEGTIFWSRHCWYQGFSFVESNSDMTSSNRRFWSYSNNNTFGSRSIPIRDDVTSKQKQIDIFKKARLDEPLMIERGNVYFTKRQLLFLLDAALFSKKIPKGKRINNAIEKGCEFFKIRKRPLMETTELSFQSAKKNMLKNNMSGALRIVRNKYEKYIK